MKPEEVFELKFSFNSFDRIKLKALLDFYLDKDPYFKGKLITDYYDDANYSAFYENIDGLVSKKKFRFRTYLNNNDNSSAKHSVEIKKRKNQTVSKEKVFIYDEQYLDMTPTYFHHLIEKLEENDLAGLNKIKSEMLLNSPLKLSSRVLYNRRRYIDDLGNRYNLDTNIVLEVYYIDKIFSFSIQDIFEVKSKNKDICLKFLNPVILERVSYSKYGIGIFMAMEGYR